MEEVWTRHRRQKDPNSSDMSTANSHQSSFSLQKTELLSPLTGKRERSRSREPLSRQRSSRKSTFFEDTNFSEKQYLAGLTIAGLASTLLSTIFNLFYLDTFLTAYKLPLSAYVRGNIIYTAVNTANDLLGAWFVDSLAMRSSRSSIVGITGYVFTICFLTPFFRWKHDGPYSSRVGDTVHFAASMSLYDTMYDFSTILYGSMFTDYHNLDEKSRVGFMASGNIVNMVASFAVARVGLALFTAEDLSPFRYFVLVLSILACVLFVFAQHTMPQTRNVGGVDDIMGKEKLKPKKKLDVYQVARDFASHKNFRVWIVTEMLLESQAKFSSSFLKTFVDRLLIGSDLSEGACDMILSSIPPLCQIAGICLYVPIHNHGYQKIYMYAYQSKFTLSLFVLIFGSPASVQLVAMFLIVDMVLTSAVQSSGFYLAMGDMVAEMKLDQLKEGRFDEPSLAGLFIGANALMCKPMGAFLPLVAAWTLSKVGFSNETDSAPSMEGINDEIVAGSDHSVRSTLFYLLVVPSLIFSAIQIIAWSRFDIDGKRAEELRTELRALQEKYEYEDGILP